MLLVVLIIKKETNTQCVRYVEFVNVKRYGTCSNHWALQNKYTYVYFSQQLRFSMKKETCVSWKSLHRKGCIFVMMLLLLCSFCPRECLRQICYNAFCKHNDGRY